MVTANLLTHLQLLCPKWRTGVMSVCIQLMSAAYCINTALSEYTAVYSQVMKYYHWIHLAILHHLYL